MPHSDLSIWSLWLIHIVTQYNHAYRSVCDNHNVNTIWVSLCCSFMSQDFARNCVGEKLCSLPKFFVAMTSWFFSRMNWLKSDSPIVRFSTGQKFFVFTCLQNFENYVQVIASNWTLICTKKITRIFLDIFQSPNIRYKLDCSWKQWCCKVIFLENER